MAKVVFSKRAQGATTPIEEIKAQIASFWQGPEKIFPIPYWKLDQFFEDYQKIAFHINGTDDDDINLNIEVMPFVASKINEYENDSFPGYLFVLKKADYDLFFLPRDKGDFEAIIARIGRNNSGEVFVFLHKTAGISTSEGMVGPDGAGSGYPLP